MQEDKRKKPKEYMRMAVEVMKKSIPERKKDDPSPYVGAVLVFPDGTVDTACRGEYREGDHAEYTVLDKKNRHHDLSECWLFATLEPCGPGARNAPKVSCSERIVNARITKVWFGIEDKNPKVDHGGIDYLKNNGVIVNQFDSKFHKEIEEINKKFNTWAKMKNAEAKTKKPKPKNQLTEKADGSTLDSLSNEALQKFLTKSGRNWEPDSHEFLQDLKEMELLEYDHEDETYFPTGNAILLFGKRPRNKFPQAAVKAKVDYGSGKLGTETFDDPLVLIPDKVDEWINKVLPVSIDRSEFKAKHVPNFPSEIIREALINAIIHRDYTLDGAKVQLEIKPDRIIVKSPGAPASPVTIESLKKFTATSWSRNKKLAFIFNEMGYMEESGIGMDTFRSLREKYQQPLPIIDYDGSNVIVTFPRNTEAIRDIIGKDALYELNNNELTSFEIFRINQHVTKTEFVEYSGLAIRTAERLLKKFVDLELITKQGSGRSTKYIINE